MMKNKIVAYLIAGIAAVLALGSCSSGVSYAELLRDERKATNKFLAYQRVENEIPADSIFETGPAAPCTSRRRAGKSTIAPRVSVGAYSRGSRCRPFCS